MIRFCLLSFYLLISTSHGCSYSCDLSEDYRVCLDNVWGVVAADCSGFIGCVNMTQPCAGECQPEYPVVSEDGLSCTACQEDGEEDVTAKVCPQCKDGEVWCRAEEACKLRTAVCGGKCHTLLYPVLNVTRQECSPCSEYSRWCQEEGRCFDPESEPCNGECHTLGLRYCQDLKSCLGDDVPCGSILTGDSQIGNLPTTDVQSNALALPYGGPLQQQFFLFPYLPLPYFQLPYFPHVPINIDAALQWKSEISGNYIGLNDESIAKGKSNTTFLGHLWFGWTRKPLWNVGIPIVAGSVATDQYY